MKMKTKKDEITPWQTFEEKTLTSAFVSPVLKMKNQENKDRNLTLSNFKPKTTEKKRLSTIESLIRLKTSNQKTQWQHFSPLKKIPSQKVRELVPLNGNLINVINSVHQNSNKQNPQTFRQRSSMKKIVKNSSKNPKSQKNKISIDPKVTFEKRKQQIQNLKRSLIQKINPSLDILLKAKQHLSHIDSTHIKPILRSYSIHNIRLNSIQQRDISNVIHTDRRISKNKSKLEFSSTGQNFRPKSDMRYQMMKKRINSIGSREKNQHIIDRLYDRFQ